MKKVGKSKSRGVATQDTIEQMRAILPDEQFAAYEEAVTGMKKKDDGGNKRAPKELSTTKRLASGEIVADTSQLQRKDISTLSDWFRSYGQVTEQRFESMMSTGMLSSTVVRGSPSKRRSVLRRGRLTR